MNKIQKRRSELIKMLSALSRNGWEAAKEYDYKPLELELAAIERKMSSRGPASIMTTW